MWSFFKRKIHYTASYTPEPTPMKDVVRTRLSQELALYFVAAESGEYSELWDVEVNLLNFEQSEKWTDGFSLHPIIQAFGGRVLDDPNTSNHHIYLSQSVLKGCVLFLSHDGDTRIVYSTLEDFLCAADAAKWGNLALSEIHPKYTPILENQAALSTLILDFLESGDMENEGAILALIPSMDLRDEALMIRLVTDSNFFFGEAVAIEIEKKPTIELLQIAELCLSHAHIQVRDAGNKALAAIGQLNSKI